MRLPILLLATRSIVALAFAMYDVDIQLYEGNECRLENGDKGICRKLPECPPRLEEVKQGLRNSESGGRCGFENFVEIVCCPLPQNFTRTIGPRIAEIACQQYDNEILSDSNTSSDELAYHILGGDEALTGEFPYAVALGYENTDLDDDPAPIKYSCGGTLISSEHVLTAAHCVSNINEKVPVEVRLGSEDLRSTAPGVQRINISNIIMHPKYKRSANYHDVAILRLKRKVELSTTAKPICLQTKPLHELHITKNHSVVTIGWGATSFANDNSPKLMRTPTLSLVQNEVCGQDYQGFLKLPRGLDESLICAKDSNDTRLADACQGDSGGPLLLLSETGDSIIGITAFGQACGSPIPGVYTAVYPYLDWIEQMVWSDASVFKTAVVKLTPKD